MAFLDQKEGVAMRKSKSLSALTFLAIGLFLLGLSNFVDELRVYQGAQIAVYVIAISSIILLTFWATAMIG